MVAAENDEMILPAVVNIPLKPKPGLSGPSDQASSVIIRG
jgi:hypothetical protein